MMGQGTLETLETLKLDWTLLLMWTSLTQRSPWKRVNRTASLTGPLLFMLGKMILAWVVMTEAWPPAMLGVE